LVDSISLPLAATDVASRRETTRDWKCMMKSIQPWNVLLFEGRKKRTGRIDEQYLKELKNAERTARLYAKIKGMKWRSEDIYTLSCQGQFRMLRLCYLLDVTWLLRRLLPMGSCLDSNSFRQGMKACSRMTRLRYFTSRSDPTLALGSETFW
jgi:hypothetical protein